MISFYVPGQPQGKARARSRIRKTREGKLFTSHYTPKNTRSYEESIATVAKAHMCGKKPTQKPVRLDLTIYLGVPTGWPKWKREAAVIGKIAPTTKPDADNVLKAVKDALNQVCWVDDSQVVIVLAIKAYDALHPGIAVAITELDLAPAQISRKSDLMDSLEL